MSDVEIEGLKRQLAEARALLEWPERDTLPTLAEVDAGHAWWMAREVREQRWHMIYCVRRAIGNPPLARVMAVGNGWSLGCYDRFRCCTPDGKPALLPEVKG